MATLNVFSRCRLMLGDEDFARLRNAKVAVFGLGGVGSWCAEALARSGVGKMMIVDADRVAASNVNRQIIATTSTIGRIKAEVMAERLRDINPEISLEVRPETYTAASAASFHLENYDYVIDAIDSLEHKANLIRHALSIESVTLFSSMGAALKMDVSLVRTSEFKKVAGDGLARALRQRFRKNGGMPRRKFMCVWSSEHRENKGISPLEDDLMSQPFRKARINGALVHVTAVFGLTLASLVVAKCVDSGC